jgi:hypothetical protein
MLFWESFARGLFGRKGRSYLVSKRRCISDKMMTMVKIINQAFWFIGLIVCNNTFSQFIVYLLSHIFDQTEQNPYISLNGISCDRWLSCLGQLVLVSRMNRVRLGGVTNCFT